MTAPADPITAGRAGSWPLLLAGAFALLFGSKLWLVAQFGNPTPYWDSWDVEAWNLYVPWYENRLSWFLMTVPHNEHRVITQRVIDLLLLTANRRVWDPVQHMQVNMALHAAVLTVFIAWLARPLSPERRQALLLFALVLLVIPFGGESFLFGFNTQFFLVLGFTLAGLYLLNRAPALGAAWWAGFILCGLSYLSLASGAFTLVVAAMMTALKLALRLERGRRPLVALALLAVAAVAALATIPTIPGHEPLKAHSFGQFWQSLMQTASWLSGGGLPGALAANLPLLALVVLLLRQRPPAGDDAWFLLAVGVWVAAGIASTAYGRALVELPPARYLNALVLGVLVNFAALCHLSARLRRPAWAPPALHLATAGWLLFVFVSVAERWSRRLVEELVSWRDRLIAEETNLRAFLATDDIAFLTIPPLSYPDPERLAMILRHPIVRDILPNSLVEGHHGRFDALRDWLLQAGPLIAAIGCAALVMGFVLARRPPVRAD